MPSARSANGCWRISPASTARTRLRPDGSPRARPAASPCLGATETRHGRLACSWKLDGATFSTDITIPPNTTAEVILPVTGEILEGDVPARDRPGVRAVDGNRLTIGAPTPADTVIELEYFCVGGMPSFPVIPGPPFDKASSRQLPPLGHSETWSTYASRISTARTPLPGGWKELRIDLPLPADRTLQLRNARLRQERPGEFDPARKTASASSSRETLQAYLDRDFPGTISKVSVGNKAVRIEGNAGDEREELFLADIPMDQLLDNPGNWRSLIKIDPEPTGDFLIDLPRHRKRDGLDYDRLTSRWQLVRKTGEDYKPLSHARYAEWVASRSPSPPPARPASKKGLGGWRLGLLPNELNDLGISAVTVNLMVHPLISLEPGPGTIPTRWQGKPITSAKTHLQNMTAPSSRPIGMAR
jgi:hypothetical protein